MSRRHKRICERCFEREVQEGKMCRRCNRETGSAPFKNTVDEEADRVARHRARLEALKRDNKVPLPAREHVIDGVAYEVVWPREFV